MMSVQAFHSWLVVFDGRLSTFQQILWAVCVCVCVALTTAELGLQLTYHLTDTDWLPVSYRATLYTGWNVSDTCVTSHITRFDVTTQQSIDPYCTLYTVDRKKQPPSTFTQIGLRLLSSQPRQSWQCVSGSWVMRVTGHKIWHIVRSDPGFCGLQITWKFHELFLCQKEPYSSYRERERENFIRHINNKHST